MAFELVLPLFGLDPKQFSALNAKLLCIENLEDLPDSGRISPSARSDSSGVSSLEFIESTPELTPVSSRPASPTDEPGRSQEKREERISITIARVGANSLKCNIKEEDPETDTRCRVVYRGRDLLNLGANIREPYWQIRDPFPQFRCNNDNFGCSISQSYITGCKNTFIDNYATEYCNDCGFCISTPKVF